MTTFFSLTKRCGYLRNIIRTRPRRHQRSIKPMAFFVALLSSQISVCCRLRTRASDKILKRLKLIIAIIQARCFCSYSIISALVKLCNSFWRILARISSSFDRRISSRCASARVMRSSPTTALPEKKLLLRIMLPLAFIDVVMFPLKSSSSPLLLLVYSEFPLLLLLPEGEKGRFLFDGELLRVSLEDVTDTAELPLCFPEPLLSTKNCCFFALPLVPVVMLILGRFCGFIDTTVPRLECVAG
mmetsp:Transcript_55749/g.97676  ORF Transcript_55749/g.97676 Transcript_55749/m.97676 type:complete len:243 (-) Transcript_55749:1099-1827(-)